MKSILPFSLFQVFFFAIMWTSKTIHPIFFEKSGHLANFGLSYSAMAFAGYFSFLIGSLTDRLGSAKTLGFGSVFYAIGIFLRSFPESPAVAIASGLIAGVGASMALNSLRLWMLENATSDSKARWVGLKSSTNALGIALGCALAGFLPGISSHSISMKDLMMSSASALFIVGTIILIFSHRRRQSTPSPVKQSPFADIKMVFQNHRRLALFTSAIGVMTGFYVSFVSPYLPLIMKQKGLSMSSIGFSIGGFSLLRFFADPMIARWIEKRKTGILPIFLTSEIFILIVTGLFAISISKESFIGFLLIRSLSLGFSTISEELLWIQKFPREIVGLLFGLNQSAFFLGDFFGGILNGFFYQKYGLASCATMAVLVILVNSYLFILLFKEKKEADLPITAEALS